MNERPGHADATLAELVDHGGSGIDILALPAIFFRYGQADQAHGREFLEQVSVPCVGLVPIAAFFAWHLVRDPAG